MNTGKELHLDGSNKAPYRHPHFSQNKQSAAAPEQRHSLPAQNQLEVLNPTVDAHVEAEENVDKTIRNTQVNRELQFDNRRTQALVKPAKMHIPEFDG